MAKEYMDEVTKRTSLAFTNHMEMLTFQLTDGQQYGINVFKIIEVIETPAKIIKMPGVHHALVGTINFRDRAVTVIDLAQGVGLEPVPYRTVLSYIIVCEYSNTTQGLLISNPNKLVNKGWDEIKKPNGSSFDSAYLSAITYEDDGTAIQILDVEKILGEIIGIDDEVPEELILQSQTLDRNHGRVLVVDDSSAARAMLKIALDRMGVQSTIVDGAQRGLQVLIDSLDGPVADRFRLIISDIEMPGMDGFTFTREVKNRPDLAGIPLVLHSSLSNESNRIKATQMGAEGFLAKYQPEGIAKLVLRYFAPATAV